MKFVLLSSWAWEQLAQEPTKPWRYVIIQNSGHQSCRVQRNMAIIVSGSGMYEIVPPAWFGAYTQFGVVQVLVAIRQWIILFCRVGTGSSLVLRRCTTMWSFVPVVFPWKPWLSWLAPGTEFFIRRWQSTSTSSVFHSIKFWLCFYVWAKDVCNPFLLSKKRMPSFIRSWCCICLLPLA